MEQKLRGSKRTGLSISLDEKQALEASVVWTSHPYLKESEIYMIGIRQVKDNPNYYKSLD